MERYAKKNVTSDLLPKTNIRTQANIPMFPNTSHTLTHRQTNREREV